MYVQLSSTDPGGLQSSGLFGRKVGSGPLIYLKSTFSCLLECQDIVGRIFGHKMKLTMTIVYRLEDFGKCLSN